MTEFFKKQRTCEQCGKVFKEKDNICRFKCGFHFGHYVNQKWTCCHHKSKSRIGCIKKDHHDKETSSKTYPTLTIKRNEEDQDLQKMLLKSIEPIFVDNEYITILSQKFICKRTTC